MSSRWARWLSHTFAAVCIAAVTIGAPAAQQTRPFVPQFLQLRSKDPTNQPAPYRALVSTYCLSCHNGKMKAGGFQLDAVNNEDLGAHQEAWERVVRKLRARQMPPQNARRPDEATHMAALTALETALDAASATMPNPGRTDTFRRLNRTEYRNAIRDLLALEIDPAALLPSDSASFGFDNVTVGNLSPTLLESYVSAAERSASSRWGGPASRWAARPNA